MSRIKACNTCGVKPVIEHWASGGSRFAVRCDNPDRPDSCDRAFYYSISNSKEEAIRKWNEFQERPLTSIPGDPVNVEELLKEAEP